ncbi:DpnII family type II restriction endonuclease [Megamonas funiformis]|uniref:DpnII family type II restriction endonuclease n=1 Tax=Megamonas funiformis TaxID=437897 RepID=UPI00241F8D28|nr:DpnII family type II restriction endonuclease [Megamonas funiformis]
MKEDFNIDLSNLKIDEIFKSSKKEKSEKKFDFVVKTEQKYYLIETNFYTTQGSKLNETARSYKELALEFKDLDNIDFVWITDGKGWQTTKKNLQETFNILDNIYNINDMENGILTKLFNKKCIRIFSSAFFYIIIL